jgi:hypothetical protein
MRYAILVALAESSQLGTFCILACKAVPSWELSGDYDAENPEPRRTAISLTTPVDNGAVAVDNEPK